MLKYYYYCRYDVKTVSQFLGKFFQVLILQMI